MQILRERTNHLFQFMFLMQPHNLNCIDICIAHIFEVLAHFCSTMKYFEFVSYEIISNDTIYDDIFLVESHLLLSKCINLPAN